MKTGPCREFTPGPLARSKFADLYVVARTAIATSNVSFCYGSSIVTGCFLTLGVLMYAVINVLKDSVIRSLFLQSDCRNANKNKNKNRNANANANTNTNTKTNRKNWKRKNWKKKKKKKNNNNKED